MGSEMCIRDRGYPAQAGSDFLQQLELLVVKLKAGFLRYTGEVSAWPRQAGDKACSNRIFRKIGYGRDVSGRSLLGLSTEAGNSQRQLPEIPGRQSWNRAQIEAAAMGGMEAARACRKRYLLSALRSHLSGNLLPLAWNFWPNSLSLPPPAGFSWHCPQGKPVCCANTGVAAAFRGKTNNIVAATQVAIATVEAPAMPSNVMFRISVTSD